MKVENKLAQIITKHFLNKDLTDVTTIICSQQLHLSLKEANIVTDIKTSIGSQHCSTPSRKWFGWPTQIRW